MKVHIPDSLDEAKRALNGLGKLLTAKEWERAAIVAAYADPGAVGGRKVKSSSRFDATAFARLGINGFRTADTVIRYVNAWKDAGMRKPQPGQDVELPTVQFPKESRSDAQQKGDAERFLKGATSQDKADFVQKAILKDPEVAKAAAMSVAKVDPKAVVQAVSKVAPRVVSKAADEIEWGPELPPLSGKHKATPAGDVMLTQIMLKTWLESKRALSYVQNYEGNVPKISREAILEDLGRIRAVLDFIETRVKAGGPIDWDADFEALLEEN